MNEFISGDRSEPPNNTVEAEAEMTIVQEPLEPEQELKFEGLKKPSDVLKLPSYLREAGLESLKEKLVEKRLKIAELQAGIFEYIRQQHSRGTLTSILLTAHIDQLFDDPDFTEDDRQIATRILRNFDSDYSVIKRASLHPDEDLLKRYSAWRLSEAKLHGGYKIVRNALSFDFIFEKQVDFELFVEKNHKGIKRNLSGVGLSYHYDGVPLTATSMNSESTLKHEIQHKEFSVINIDAILTDSKLERSTRDELLSFYIEADVDEEYSFNAIDTILIKNYKFHEKNGVSDDKYRKMVLNAVKAIRELEKIFSTKEEIVNILRREPLNNWNRIAKRLSESQILQSRISSSGEVNVAAQRKLKNEESNRKWAEIRDRARNRFMDSIKMLVADPLVFHRHANNKGQFYARIDKKVIVDMLRNKMNSPYSYKIGEKNVTIEVEVQTYGEYKYTLTFGEDKIDGLIQVVKF